MLARGQQQGRLYRQGKRSTALMIDRLYQTLKGSQAAVGLGSESWQRSTPINRSAPSGRGARLKAIGEDKWKP